VFNSFTRFNIAIGQYLLYVYLIVLTIVVIVQIDKLHEANSKLTAYVNKHEQHNKDDAKQQADVDAHEQLLIKKLDIERKELHYEVTVLKHELKVLKERYYVPTCP